MDSPPLTYDNIVALLLQEVQQLRPLFDDHIRQYDELLPHVFLGDLTRFVLNEAAKALTGEGREARKTVAEVLNFLERAMGSGEPKVQELVSVSFLENLDPSTKAYKSVKAMLGPNLSRELAMLQK